MTCRTRLTILAGGVATAAALALTAPVLAQPAPAPAAQPPAAREGAAYRRYQLHVMEGALERAVQVGAQLVSTEMRQFAPDVVLFMGPARARGYRLDGYGVFFSVDVPAVRRSLTWSIRTLNRGGLDVTRALQSLRRYVDTQGDETAKKDLDQALRLIELQVGPLPAVSEGSAMATPVAESRGVRGAPVVVAPEAERAAGDAPATGDPDALYEQQVKSALIEAMLDYGATLDLSGDDWLTIAARDTGDGIIPGDLNEMVTITLRIRGRDLADHKVGRLSRDEARRRIEVREF